MSLNKLWESITSFFVKNENDDNQTKSTTCKKEKNKNFSDLMVRETNMDLNLKVRMSEVDGDIIQRVESLIDANESLMKTLKNCHADLTTSLAMKKFYAMAVSTFPSLVNKFVGFPKEIQDLKKEDLMNSIDLWESSTSLLQKKLEIKTVTLFEVDAEVDGTITF